MPFEAFHGPKLRVRERPSPRLFVELSLTKLVI